MIMFTVDFSMMLLFELTNLLNYGNQVKFSGDSEIWPNLILISKIICSISILNKNNL